MKIYEIYFSPTGGTKKVADLLANQLGGEVIPYDITNSKKELFSIALQKEDIAVIAVPSYGGRVPQIAIQHIAAITGNGANAILLCVYGNRAYEDTLVELYDKVKAGGFQVIAAVAAIAEHSIVRQIAAGRPDTEDKKQLSIFAKQISAKLAAGHMEPFLIPGNRPYKKYSKMGMVPKPTKKCVKCGVCAKACPTHAIDSQNPKKVRTNMCISCMKCVSICPHTARTVNHVILFAAQCALKTMCRKRKRCELFL